MIPKEQFAQVRVNGQELEIAYRLNRKSENAVVYVHGLGNSKDDFPMLWEKLAGKEHSFLTYDAVGFGNSSKPEEFSYSMHEQADVLGKLLGEVGIERTHLVGYSMGGGVSLKFSQKFPEKVLSFINVEGNLTANDAVHSRIIYMLGLEELSNGHWAKYEDWGSTPYALYHTAQELVKESDSGKLLQEFLEIPHKKYYVYGEKNEKGVSQTMMRLNNVPCVMIPNSGHSFIRDNPIETCQKIAELIE